MGEKVKIRIKDREYIVRGSDDREQILKVAAYVDKKLKEISDSKKELSEDKTAILAALDIAGDYFQLIKEREDLLTEINNRSANINVEGSSPLPLCVFFGCRKRPNGVMERPPDRDQVQKELLTRH
jgi:cell division protein ZapA (FtsZ GTPase activity inhibitor)